MPPRATEGSDAIVTTSFDVAKAAGVSQSTVSRALSGNPSISAETVRKVREAAVALNYVPIDRARDLSLRSTRRVAMVVDLDNPLWSMLVNHIYDELAAHQFRLSLVAEHGDPTDIESHVLGGSVDGVIVSTASLESTLPDLLRKRGVPTVLLHRFAEGSEIDACVADNCAGGSMAARILIEAGHRDIGALFGPSETSTGLERERGFTETLADAGISLDPRSVVKGDFTYEHGTAAVSRLIANDALPRALFCANDIIAVGAMNAARAAGLRVPEDLALVGFDDLAQSAWPIIDLTTIKVPFDDMLRSAVSLLVSRIRGEEGTWRRVIHPVSPVLRSTHQLS